jgi:hypothetical protein
LEIAMVPVRLALLSLAALIAGCTADIRTDRLKADALAPDRVQHGRELLAKLAEHYGAAAWKQHHTTELVFHDDWASALAWITGKEPWDQEDQVRLRWQCGADTARADFLAGPRKGEAEGMKWQRTYLQKSGWARPRPVEDPELRFILRALTFLTEMPFRIGDAETVTYEGTETLDGKTYDRVFATWGALEAHSDADQYLLWIDQGSGDLVRADFTVRQTAKFYRTTAWFSDLRTIDGARLPLRITLTDFGKRPSEGYVHDLKAETAAFDSFPAVQLDPTAAP